MKKVLASVGLILIIALGVVIAVPVLSVESWKSSTLEQVNQTTETVNVNEAGITNFAELAEPSNADYDKVISDIKSSIKSQQQAKEQIPALSGFQGIDITGDYKTAQQTRVELEKIYSDLIASYQSQLKTVEKEKAAGGPTEATLNDYDANANRVNQLVDRLNQITQKLE